MSLHAVKNLPHSLEAERAVLGGLMLWDDRDSWSPDEIGAIITPEDFYREAHGKLFELLMLEYEEGNPLEMVAIVEAVHATGDPNLYGGLSYVSQMPDTVPSTENVSHYAKVVLDAAENRRTIQQLRWCHDALVNRRASRRDVLDELETWMGAAGMSRGRNTPQPVHKMTGRVFGSLRKAAEGRGGSYLTSGVVAFDECAGFAGVSKVGVTLLIARVGIGKTSAINSMAIGQARAGLRVGLYGTETTKEQRTTDLIFAIAGVNQMMWNERCREREMARKEGRPLPFEDWINARLYLLDEARMKLDQLPIKVFPQGWAVERICGTVKRMCRRGELDVFMLDYLQDIAHTQSLPLDMGKQATHKSKMLKDTQAVCKIPFVVTAQAKPYQEAPTATGDNSFLVPQAEDTAWASQLHKDAEEVWTLYRRDYYAGRFPEADDKDNLPGYHGTMTIALRKRRVGGDIMYHLPFHVTLKWLGDR